MIWQSTQVCVYTTPRHFRYLNRDDPRAKFEKGLSGTDYSQFEDKHKLLATKELSYWNDSD
jgi:hypothetical protein